jgi:hypothetical protein
VSDAARSNAVETQSASRVPESPEKIDGLETLELLESVAESVASPNWSVNIEDQQPTSFGSDEVEEGSSGYRDDKANDQSFEDGVDIPAASQESAHSSAVEGQQKQTPTPVHRYPKNSNGSQSTSKRTRKPNISHPFPTGSTALQATDLPPRKRKMKARKGTLGRVKLMSTSKNSLGGVGEIILSSALISDRLVRLKPVNAEPVYSKKFSGYPAVEPTSEGSAPRSIVQYPHAQTDAEVVRRPRRISDRDNRI